MKSEFNDFYIPGSLLALYLFCLVLALILLIFAKLCCKTNRVQFYHQDKQEKAKEAAAFAARPENDDYGVGKDLKEFEMAKKAKKWRKKGQSRSLMIDDQCGSIDDLTKVAEEHGEDKNANRDQKDMFDENMDRLAKLRQMMKEEMARSKTEKSVGWTDQQKVLD